MCVMGGLLSSGFGLVLDKVNIADSELSGLYVYSWICGVGIKGDFILQSASKLCFQGLGL